MGGHPLTPQARILGEVRAGTEPARRRAFYLDRHHYLGRRVVGENLGYLVQDRHDQEVACVLFGAPAWRCGVRDAFLGWGPPERPTGLSSLANNTRLLILPRVPTYCYTSLVLSCQGNSDCCSAGGSEAPAWTFATAA